MISVLITAWREPVTIKKTLDNLIPDMNSLSQETELLIITPDIETRDSALEIINKHNYKNYKLLEDPQKGKPFALNIILKEAKGEVIVSTDGDTVVTKGSLKHLLSPIIENNKVGGVTGRPICSNPRTNMFGYWGHMFMEGAHKKRTEVLSKGGFYVLSGYLLAMRNLKWNIPAGALDDIYFSYVINEKGYKIAYAPEATVEVKQPTTMKDWLKQKIRSVAGHSKMGNYVSKDVRTRSIWEDLAYAFFPLQFAKSPKEFIWSLYQYPIRLYIWIASWWNTHVKGKTATDLWVRTNSTK